MGSCSISAEEKKWFLTCAAAHVLRHNATEVPEAWLTAVTLLSPNTRFARALASGWITGSFVGTIDITLTGTWEEQTNNNIRPKLCNSLLPHFEHLSGSYPNVFKICYVSLLPQYKSWIKCAQLSFLFAKSQYIPTSTSAFSPTSSYPLANSLAQHFLPPLCAIIRQHHEIFKKMFLLIQRSIIIIIPWIKMKLCKWLVL